VAGFGIEQADVLLSVQLVLIREQESAASPTRAASEAVKRLPRPVSIATRTPHPNSRALHPTPVASPPPLMVDPETGVGTVHALRRDLGLERAARPAQAGRWAVVVLTVQSLDQIRLVMGDEPVRDLFMGLVEIAPFALHARDRLYRTGREELSVLFPYAEEGAVEDGRARLEGALAAYLADRGLPAVTLVARVIDPAVVLPVGAGGAPRSVAF
jgi:hypothetical protein